MHIVTMRHKACHRAHTVNYQENGGHVITQT